MKNGKKPEMRTVTPAALNLASVVLFAVSASLGATGAVASDTGQANKVCSQTAKLALKACGNDVKDNYLIAQAKCLNITDANEQTSCLNDAKSTRQDDQ